MAGGEHVRVVGSSELTARWLKLQGLLRVGIKDSTSGQRLDIDREVTNTLDLVHRATRAMFASKLEKATNTVEP